MIISTKLPDNAKASGWNVASTCWSRACRRALSAASLVRCGPAASGHGDRVDRDLVGKAAATALYTRNPAAFAGLGPRVRHLPESGYLAWQ